MRVERRARSACVIVSHHRCNPQFVQVFQKLVLDNIDKEWRIAEDEFRAFVARHIDVLTALHGTPHPATLPGASWEAAIVTWDDEVLKEFAEQLRSWKRKVMCASWVRGVIANSPLPSPFVCRAGLPNAAPTMACQTTHVETDAVHALTALVKRSRRRQRAALLGGTKTAATPVSPGGNDVDAKPAAPPACSDEPSLQDGIASWCSLREVFGDRCRMALDDESKGEAIACISPVDVTQVLRVGWWGCKALSKAFTRPCVLVPVSGECARET